MKIAVLPQDDKSRSKPFYSLLVGLGYSQYIYIYIYVLRFQVVATLSATQLYYCPFVGILLFRTRLHTWPRFLIGKFRVGVLSRTETIDGFLMVPASDTFKKKERDSSQLTASLLQWFTVGGSDSWFLVWESCPYMMFRTWFKSLDCFKDLVYTCRARHEGSEWIPRRIEWKGRETHLVCTAQVGNLYYNFWQDADHVKGIWRRCTLEDYQLLGFGEKQLVTGSHRWPSFDCYCAPDQSTVSILLMCVHQFVFLHVSIIYIYIYMYLCNGICRFYSIYYSIWTYWLLILSSCLYFTYNV